MKLQKTIACLLAQFALIGNIHAQTPDICGSPIVLGIHSGIFITQGARGEPAPGTGGPAPLPEWRNYAFIADNAPTVTRCVNIVNADTLVRHYVYTAFVLGARAQINYTRETSGGITVDRITEIRVFAP